MASGFVVSCDRIARLMELKSQIKATQYPMQKRTDSLLTPDGLMNVMTVVPGEIYLAFLYTFLQRWQNASLDQCR